MRRPRRWLLPAVRLGIVLALGVWLYGRVFSEPAPLPVAAFGGVSVGAGGARWAMADGDSGATRRTSAVPVLQEHATWSVQLDNKPELRPVADEQHLYVGLTDNRLVALDLDDGTLTWTYAVQHRLWSPPTLAGNRLYFALATGHVVALNGSTGASIWATPLNAIFYAAPAVIDGIVIAAAERVVFGLDAETGAVLWEVEVDHEPITAAPVIFDQRLVLRDRRGIALYDIRTGAQTYRFREFQPSAALGEGRTVFTVSPGFVSAVDSRSKSPWWEPLRSIWFRFFLWRMAPLPPPQPSLWVTTDPTADEDEVIHPPTLTDELVVVAQAGGTVRALRRDSGAVAWEIDAGPQAGAPAFTAAGILLVGIEALSLRAPADGSERAHVPLPTAAARHALVTFTGTYVVDSAGRVSAYSR